MTFRPGPRIVLVLMTLIPVSAPRGLGAQAGESGRTGVRWEEDATHVPDRCLQPMTTCARAAGWAPGFTRADEATENRLRIQSSAGWIWQEQEEGARTLPPFALGGILGAVAGAGLGAIIESNSESCGDPSGACVLIGAITGAAFGVLVGLIVPSDSSEDEEERPPPTEDR